MRFCAQLMAANAKSRSEAITFRRQADRRRVIQAVAVEVAGDGNRSAQVAAASFRNAS